MIKSIIGIALAVTMLSSIAVVVVNDASAINAIELRKRIEQRNEAIARQNGGSSIQNQANTANLQTDNTDLTQANKATSEGAKDSTINQDNNAKLEGSGNTIRQSNEATQESSEEGGGSQTAVQSNSN